MQLPAYREFAMSHADGDCGAAMLAETSVAVPFVSAVAGALAVTQAIRVASGLAHYVGIAGDLGDLRSIRASLGRSLSCVIVPNTLAASGEKVVASEECACAWRQLRLLLTSSEGEPLTAHLRKRKCCPTLATETSYLQRCRVRSPAIRAGSSARSDSTLPLVCARYGRDDHGVGPQYRAKSSRIAHHMIPPGLTISAQEVRIRFAEDLSRYRTASELFNWCRITYRPQLSSWTHVRRLVRYSGFLFNSSVRRLRTPTLPKLLPHGLQFGQ
jgi:hypothetical protein